MRSEKRPDEVLDKGLYTRTEAARYLSMALSTLEVLISQHQVRIVRHGKSILIPREEVIRLSRTNFDRIWPEKIDGKTRRRLA